MGTVSSRQVHVPAYYYRLARHAWVPSVVGRYMYLPTTAVLPDMHGYRQ